MNGLKMMKRMMASVLIFAMAMSLSGVKGNAAAGQTRVSEEKEQEADVLQDTVTYQPKHLLADAVNRLKQLESGGSAKRHVDVAGHEETDVYYDVLTDDEKMFYNGLGTLYETFDPYSSSDVFFNKVKGYADYDEALYDDIMSGKVLVLDFQGKYTRDGYKELYNNAVMAYNYDHPYNLESYMYRSAYIFKNGRMYQALSRTANGDAFDYVQWTTSLVQFEQQALTEIVNDPRFSDTEAAIKEYLVHEYICSKVTYDDSDPVKSTIRWFKIKSAYGPMVEYAGVCIGIAKMAKILLDDLNVPTYIVNSKTHAWNMVYLDGGLYELDCTWDLARDGAVRYKYFNRTTTELLSLDPSGAHIRDTNAMRLPIAEGTLYDYESVCEMMKIEEEVNPDGGDNPTYATDDYVEEDVEGEIYPSLNNYKYKGLKYDLSSDGYAILKGATGNPKSVTIPKYAVYKDSSTETTYYYPVYVIAPKAFASKKKLNKVVICDEMLIISKNAFNGCKNLKKITFKNGGALYEIEKGAFKGISAKATITIKADSAAFKLIKKMIKAAGAPKKVKYKRT